MRVAFVTPYDSADPLQWSGTGFHMGEALRRAGLDVVRVSSLEIWPLVTRVRRRLVNAGGNGWYRADYDPLVMRRHARVIRRAVIGAGADVVLGPHTPVFGSAWVDAPLVVWPDATFAQLHAYMSSFSGICPSSVRTMQRVEEEVLNRSALAVFPSEWAAASARGDYGLPPDRVAVVPYGANVDPAPDAARVEAALASRPRKTCRLVAIGVDWVRKGFTMAGEAAQLLNEAGLPTTLTIVGCGPPDGQALPDCVRLEGFISKATVDGQRRIIDFLLGAHYLIMPTRAEPFAMVFAEASACGTPSLATRTGGLEGRVLDGVTGHLVPPDAGPEAYRDAVLGDFDDYACYESMASAARRDYETRLNWGTAARSMAMLLERVMRGELTGAHKR